MILLFLSLALLVIVVLALLLPVLTRQAHTSEPNRTAINAGIARAQAEELQQRLDRGEISQEDYEDERVRLTADLARDIDNNDIEKIDSDRSEGRWVAWPLAAIIPIAAGALYLSLGSPAAIEPANRAPDMQQVVTRIRQQLSQQPDDARAWFMLGRAHLTLGEYPAAEMALRKSLEIDGNNIDVKIRLADAIALTQDGSLVGEPANILQSALKTQPNHPQGLWLYGMALNEEGDSENAIEVWNRLLPLLANDPQSVVEVQQLIAVARENMASAAESSGADKQPAGDSLRADGSVLPNGSLLISVDVAPGLATDLPASTAVFVYAKALEGPPMPLAVVKHSLGDLPLTVTLSDAQAMIENMKISAFETVIVGARISKSGDPIAQAGDLFFESGAINTVEQKQAVQVTISETLR